MKDYFCTEQWVKDVHDMIGLNPRLVEQGHINIYCQMAVEDKENDNPSDPSYYLSRVKEQGRRRGSNSFTDPEETPRPLHYQYRATSQPPTMSGALGFKSIFKPQLGSSPIPQIQFRPPERHHATFYHDPIP